MGTFAKILLQVAVLLIGIPLANKLNAETTQSFVPKRIPYDQSRDYTKWLRCYDPDRQIIFALEPHGMSTCGGSSYQISEEDFETLKSSKVGKEKSGSHQETPQVLKQSSANAVENSLNSFSADNPNMLMLDAIERYDRGMALSADERWRLLREAEIILQKIKRDHPNSIPAIFLQNGVPLDSIDMEVLTATLLEKIQSEQVLLEKDVHGLHERLMRLGAQLNDALAATPPRKAQARSLVTESEIAQARLTSKERRRRELNEEKQRLLKSNGASNPGRQAEADDMELMNAKKSPLNASEKSAIRKSVGRCWNVGSLSAEALRTTVVVGFQIDEDARPVLDSIKLLSSSGGDKNAVEQAFETARRAIIRCGSGGYDLPENRYEKWRELVLTFNPI